MPSGLVNSAAHSIALHMAPVWWRTPQEWTTSKCPTSAESISNTDIVRTAKLSAGTLDDSTAAVVFTDSGSISVAKIGPAPNFAAASEDNPEPHPISRNDLPDRFGPTSSCSELTAAAI